MTIADKRYWPVLGLLLIAFSQCVGAQSLRIVSYNARNYNLVDRRVDGRWRQDYPKPESEKEAFRKIIHLLNADIIAFQEFGPDEVFLKELQRDLKREGSDYPYLIHMKGPDSSRALGCLSRIEPSEIVRHTKVGYTREGKHQLVRRGVLEINFVDEAGRSWSLFNLHLKSRISDDAGEDPDSHKQRTAEAQAVRNLIQDRCGRGRYIVLGDLNDTPDSPAMQRFLMRGQQILAVDAHAKDSRFESWTYFHARSETYERIDIMLLSKQLAEESIWTATIFDNPLWSEAGDHRPVLLELRFH